LGSGDSAGEGWGGGGAHILQKKVGLTPMNGVEWIMSTQEWRVGSPDKG